MGRRQRGRADRPKSQGPPSGQKYDWIRGRPATVIGFVCMVLATIATVLTLPTKKIIVAVILTLIILAWVAARSFSWSWLRKARRSRALFAAVILMSLVLVIGTLVRTSATRDEPVNRATSAPKPKNEALVLVAEFAPDPKSAKTYRVSETIYQKLEAAFAQYRDVRVTPLGRALTAQDGSRTARAEGKRRGATIVIWGWYGKTSTTVALSVHFELLEELPSYLAPTLGPQTKGEVRKEPVHKLESFAIQEDLSSELLYFSEISVGLIRLFQEDADGAISHLTGALNASGKRSSTRSEVLFHRGIAYTQKSFGMPSRKSAKASLRRAVADFSEVIRRDPNLQAPSYSNRAQIYRDLGEYGRSVDDYTHAIRLSPDYGSYFGRGLSYAEIPDYAKAIADLSHAIRLLPSAEHYEQRGVLHAAKGDSQQALMDFSKAIQLKPRANTYTHRSILFQSNGRSADALNDLNTAIKLEPTMAICTIIAAPGTLMRRIGMQL
jgi:tetratricopeptide (TPR) repeat protein